MEFLIRMFICLTILFYLKTGVNGKHAPSKSVLQSDDGNLRKMLALMMEQNRKLLEQNERLQQVWNGMEQMCKAVELSSCNCVTNTNNSTNVTDMLTPRLPEFPLQIVSVNSSGIVGDQIRISVNYTASLFHTTEWIAIRENKAVWRTAGQNCEASKDNPMFTSIVDVEQLETIKEIIFHLYNDEKIVSIMFNPTELENATQQTIIGPSVRLFDLNSSYMAPPHGDLNIYTFINRSAAELNNVVSIEGYQSGVNSTSSKIFEIFTSNSEYIRIDHLSGEDVVVTIRQPYVQFGGQLTLRYQQRMTGMLKELHYGSSVKIFPPGAEDVFRNNTLGVFPIEPVTFIYPPATSILCAAIGKPLPNISVFKINRNGKEKALSTEAIVAGKYMSMKIITLSTEQNEETINGLYICRASNGYQTINSTTKVVMYEVPKFDDALTGVVQNNSNVVIVSCKSSGNPQPKLTLRLYDANGPDLINRGIYKVWKVDALISRVTLTLTASDVSDIHTVFCVASQPDQVEVSRKIEVFPGTDKIFNWDLYQNLWGL